MQVENAAQMGIMSALSTCAMTQIPATVGSNCSGLSAAVTTAIQSTSLGTAVTGAISEGYYCMNSSNVLILVRPA